MNVDLRRGYIETILRSEKLSDSIWALTAFETDRIDEIAKPMVLLKKSKESRQNASYFGTIPAPRNSS